MSATEMAMGDADMEVQPPPPI
jgi:hypothetical protein